jgi:cytochrome c553
MNTSVMLLMASFVLSLVGEDPAATHTDQALLQATVAGRTTAGIATEMSADDLAARIREDRSSAGPVLVCLSSAVLWLLLGSLAGVGVAVVAAGERKAAVCHACHGVGAPVAPTFPRLAGLSSHG